MFVKTQIVFNWRLLQANPKATYTERWKKKKNPEKEILQIYDSCFFFSLRSICKDKKNKAIIWCILNYLKTSSIFNEKHWLDYHHLKDMQVS